VLGATAFVLVTDGTGGGDSLERAGHARRKHAGRTHRLML
jgi:hypothetical protein